MSIGGRTWPSTETSGDRRYAKDSLDRRPGIKKRFERSNGLDTAQYENIAGFFVAKPQEFKHNETP